MFRSFLSAVILLALSGGLAAAPGPEDAKRANPAASGTLADALKLCEKLAGVEHEICVRQAHENQNLANSVGATPGADSGMRRAGPQNEAAPGTGSGGAGAR